MLLSVATASAQPTFKLGVRGGLNQATSTVATASNSSGTYPGYFATKSALYAWQAGAVLEVSFRHFAMQPALIFSQKDEQLIIYANGFAGIIQERQLTSCSNWLELPVNAVYTLHGFQLFAGPYVALAVGGRAHDRLIDYESKLVYGTGTGNRRFDAGVNVGLGYRQGPLQVQLGYAMGLRNLHQAPSDLIVGFPPYHDFPTDEAYSRVVQLTGTYFFKL